MSARSVDLPEPVGPKNKRMPDIIHVKVQVGRVTIRKPPVSVAARRVDRTGRAQSGLPDQTELRGIRSARLRVFISGSPDVAVPVAWQASMNASVAFNVSIARWGLFSLDQPSN